MVLTGPGDPVDAGEALTEIADRLSVAVTLYFRAQELFRQANYDGLTGLLNRESFRDHLEQAIRISARDETRGALLYLDLDRFKQVNDTEGHHAGDELLRTVAERVRKVLRAADDAARLGGDEFAVLMSRVTEPTDIEAVCRRLVQEIGQPVEIGGSSVVVEVSIGVVVFPDDGHDAASLMRKADVAMYKAKELSGSAFTFFDEAMNRDTEHRARVESRTREGLAKRQLGLQFQPKIRVSDGMVIGAEGLMRWPQAPDLHPGIYVPALEQTGLIHELTSLLVEDAHECLERCRRRGFALERIGINISPRQFQREGFCEEFLAAIDRVGARHSDFEIEVTESVLMHDVRSVIRDLETLRGAGITVALDDFGTGYSSLNMLRELPLDVVKIDRSFVAPVAESSQAKDLLGRIVEIIRSLNLQSVAEGVETEREMQILTAKQCDAVQGFLFSPALTVDDLLAFLEQRAARSA
jgi:diguanylate cyclase (GGDEF)-like protein